MDEGWNGVVGFVVVVVVSCRACNEVGTRNASVPRNRAKRHDIRSVCKRMAWNETEQAISRLQRTECDTMEEEDGYSMNVKSFGFWIFSVPVGTRRDLFGEVSVAQNVTNTLVRFVCKETKVDRRPNDQYHTSFR